MSDFSKLTHLRAPRALVKREAEVFVKESYRSEFMKDRDRILYSKAFRRLSGKTQVYLSGLDDHQRTRLTHTLEVSQIARTISYGLGLDTDLSEAIALGHDLGHTPFGHIGERTLHEIMTGAKGKDNALGSHNPFISNVMNEEDFVQNVSGFKHNLQGLKCAMRFEKNYGSAGLNLTNFTLFGIQAHSSANYKEGQAESYNSLDHYSQFLKSGCNLKNGNNAWSFEALVVAEADEIAQIHHDLEDALRGKLLTQEQITEKIDKFFSTFLDENIKDTLSAVEDEEEYITKMSQLIINLIVTRIIQETRKEMNRFTSENLGTDPSKYEEKFGKFLMDTSFEDIVAQKIVTYDSDEGGGFHDKMREFQKDTSSVILFSHYIQKSDYKGKYIIRKLFQAYYAAPEQLPDHCIKEFLVEIKKDISPYRKTFREIMKTPSKIENIILMRVICDYIAGMTDQYALKMYDELYG